MSDRIPCINPRCRRTAPADRDDPGAEIICAKCYRSLPPAIRDRWRMLDRRERKVLRRIERRRFKGTIEQPVVHRLQLAFAWRRRALWEAIHRAIVEPERPEGLDTFLDAVGLA